MVTGLPISVHFSQFRMTIQAHDPEIIQILQSASEN